MQRTIRNFSQLLRVLLILNNLYKDKAYISGIQVHCKQSYLSSLINKEVHKD